MAYSTFTFQKFVNISTEKMSFLGKLFGKGGEKDPKTTGEAIQNLRETEDMLMKKQVYSIWLMEKVLSKVYSGIFGEEN